VLRIGVIDYTGKVNSSIVNEILNRDDCVLAGVLVDKIPQDNTLKFKLYDNLQDFAKVVDAIIDFTHPDKTVSIAKNLVDNKTLLVSGTTGFTDSQFEEFKSYGKYFPIIWSANMSIGINLILSMLKTITPVIRTSFDSAIIETHRLNKKDRPSGTSKMLANTIDSYGGNKPEIASLRLGDCKGDHSIIFSNEEESITISHNVFSRNIYAKGAIEACKWGIGKEPAFYSMQDVF